MVGRDPRLSSSELRRRCPDLEPVEDPVPDGHEFALCLTHDVDRPYKTVQGLYHALAGDAGYHLRTSLPDRNPYWQFEDLMALESDLGVRSAFYVLQEPHPLRKGVRALADPAEWVQEFGRYDAADPEIADVLRQLADGSWEVGVHGSMATTDDPDRLAEERDRVEAAFGGEVVGGRQHYLGLDVPATWRHYRDVGLSYDASYGASDDWGLDHAPRPFRPFGDGFVVVPLALMEQAVPDPSRKPHAARDAVRTLVEEAAERSAAASVLWHPRLFSERDFPGYGDLYRFLVETALDAGGWVGPPRDLLRSWEARDDGPEGDDPESDDPEDAVRHCTE